MFLSEKSVKVVGIDPKETAANPSKTPAKAGKKERASAITLLLPGIVARTASHKRNPTPRNATGRKARV